MSKVGNHVAGDVGKVAGAGLLIEYPGFLVYGVKAFPCHVGNFFFCVTTGEQ